MNLPSLILTKAVFLDPTIHLCRVRQYSLRHSGVVPFGTLSRHPAAFERLLDMREDWPILVAMGEHAELAVFHRSTVLSRLPQEDRRAFLALLRRRRYRRGEVVFHHGDPGDTLHLVQRGHLKVLIPGESGEEAVLTVVGQGDLFGELTLLDGGPRSATVVALEDVETATLSRVDFMNLLRRNPAVGDALLAMLAQTIRRLTDEVTDLMLLDLRGRLAKKLLDLAVAHGERAGEYIEIRVSLTQEELASMIGATRPRVNKLLGFFEDRGAIARHGRWIAILKPDALRCWLGLPAEG